MSQAATVSEKKEALDRLRPLPAEAAAHVSSWFEVELVLAETALERRPLSRDVAERLVAGRDIGSGLSGPAGVAALNHYTALSFAAALAEREEIRLSEETLKTFHRLLSRGLSENPGRYRTEPLKRAVGEAESVFVLPRPGTLPMLMGQIGRWLDGITPGPDAAIEAHYRLLRVQPFADHNHAVARLLMNLILGLAGFPPIVIRPQHAEAYRGALTVALVQHDKTVWRRFAIERLTESLDLCLLAGARAIAAARG